MQISVSKRCDCVHIGVVRFFCREVFFKMRVLSAVFNIFVQYVENMSYVLPSIYVLTTVLCFTCIADSFEMIVNNTKKILRRKKKSTLFICRIWTKIKCLFYLSAYKTRDACSCSVCGIIIGAKLNIWHFRRYYFLVTVKKYNLKQKKTTNIESLKVREILRSPKKL